MQLLKTIPLISPWLYRLAVRGAARRAGRGDVPAVRELAAVCCTCPDPHARFLAAEGLRNLRTPEQVDLLCREVILRDHAGLRDLARGKHYLPSTPAGQALWFFCTLQAGEALSPGFQGRCPLLAEGYAAAEPVVRLQARNAARHHSSCGILAGALAGPRVTQNASRWSYDEWDIVITGLAGEAEWDRLWCLVTLAPTPLAVKGMQALKAAEWVPPGDDRLAWDELIKVMPDRWTYPQQPLEPRCPAGRPAGQVVRLCFSPDGSLLATGSCDGRITVRRTASAGAVAEFDTGQGAPRFIAIPPGNTCIISAGDDGALCCYRLADHALLWRTDPREGRPAFALPAEGSRIISGDGAGTLHVLDTRDGRLLSALPLHPSPVTCISPAGTGGHAVASGHADGTVSVASHGGGSAVLHLPGNGSPVLSLLFLPSLSGYLAVYEQGCPALWDSAAREKIRTFHDLTGRAVCTAASPAGGWFAIGSDDNTLRCWDTGTGALLATVRFYNRRITSCTASADGTLLAAGLHDGLLRILRMPRGEPVREFKGHKKAITTCMFSPDGTRLVTAGWDGKTKLWRLPGGEIVRTIDTHAGAVAVLAGPAGTLVAAVTKDGIARITDSPSGTVVRTIDLYTPSVRAAAMSPDGTYLACTGADSPLRCWNIRDGSLAAAADRHATSLRCCTFFPDGRTLVAGGWDGTCRIFRMPDAVPLRTLAGHTSIVTCCTVSRDGALLVTGSNDTTVRLWNVTEDEAYAVLRESRSEVGALALSPDETLLATGNRDGIIRIYHLPYGIPVRGFEGLFGAVTCLAFTRDGCVLAAGYDTGTCALFSMPGRYLIRTVPAHSGAVTGLAILPDGKTLVTSGADGLCRSHALPCTQFPVHASPADFPAAVPEGEQPARGPGPGPAAFHRALLAARLRGEIGICPLPDTAGCYDIQIVG